MELTWPTMKQDYWDCIRLLGHKRQEVYLALLVIVTRHRCLVILERIDPIFSLPPGSQQSVKSRSTWIMPAWRMLSYQS